MNITSYVQGRQLTLALSGEIDHHVARTVMDGISERIETYLPRECLLDFSEVVFMDSSGIAVVISALRRMEELEGKLELINVGGQPKKVLAAAGIEKMVPMA